jgi:regulator of sirC expression with transglutaminase-like and TPR domain
VGKIGLAKFRDTEAEFKKFEVGKNLGSEQVDAKTSAKLREAIDALPSLESLQSNSLERIVEQGVAGTTSLRARAHELEKRASELRRIASDVHMQQVIGQFRKVVGADEEHFDLLRASLLVAKLDDEDVNVDGYVREVERMGEEIKKSLPKDADDKARLEFLNRYLFKENGFHGSRFEYYHRANSYLNRVIDDREGIPITLSILYMELGKRIDLRILGVGLPGHFVVKQVSKNEDEQLIDVFEGGVLMTREDAAKKVAEYSDQKFRDEMLHHATDREIMQRVLRNLLSNAQRADDKEAMLRYVDALLVLAPSGAQERGFRAVLRFETGRRDEALADLDWFLENKPEGIEIEKIREMRKVFERGKR